MMQRIALCGCLEPLGKDMSFSDEIHIDFVNVGMGTHTVILWTKRNTMLEQYVTSLNSQTQNRLQGIAQVYIMMF